MIDLPLLIAFLAAAAVLTVTPGVDTAMVLRLAATSGARSAAFAALGVAIGCLAWGMAVSLGLGVLLLTSPVAYTVLKWAGSVYLLWLGAKLLLRPRQALAIGEERIRTTADSQALGIGFLTNILNPKIGVFYVTFLPQFIPAHAGVALYSFALTCIHVAMGVLWFGIVIAAMAPLGRWLRQPRVVKTLDRLTGGVLVAFGLKLALSRS